MFAVSLAVYVLQTYKVDIWFISGFESQALEKIEFHQSTGQG